MMRIPRLTSLVLLVLLLLMASTKPLRAQSFEWARVVRGAVDTAFVKPQASATDATGNTYVAVVFTDSLRLGKILLKGPRDWSVAMVKYDSTGRVVWAKALYNLQISQLAADNSAGGVFLTARNGGGRRGTWDGTALPGEPSSAFYAKCSAAGSLEWTQSLPIDYYSAFNVVADNAGSAYVLGIMPANGAVGGTSVNGGQTFVLKTNGAGTTQWVRVLHSTLMGGEADPLRPTLGPKPSGGCLVSATMGNTLYLGTGTDTPVLTASSQGEGFLSSFDAAGTHQWSRVVNDSKSTTRVKALISATAADANGNSYATGYSMGGLQVGEGGSLNHVFFLFKYDAAGTLQWIREAEVTTSSRGELLTVSPAGPTVSVFAYVSDGKLPVVGTLPLRAPYNFIHYSPQGLEQWTVADSWPGLDPSLPLFSPRSVLPYFWPRGLGNDARGNLYTVGLPEHFYEPVPPAIRLGPHTTVGKGTIVARINAYANTLRGQVYWDQNGNGQQEANEGAFPQQITGTLVQGAATTYAAVGTDGGLQAFASPGAYSLSLAHVPEHYKVSQPSSGTYTGTFTGVDQLVTGQNFGVAPIANQADVRVTLTPYGAARPGFTTRYRLTVANLGTTTIANGTATATLDGQMDYVSSTPNGSQTGQTITWAYTNLAPFARRDFDILFSLPTNLALGTKLTSTAAAPLAADVAQADNTTSTEQLVTGSFDPNDIEVNYQRLTPAQVAARLPLDYTVRFQNMGTDTAFTVVLSDTLDFRKLNLASIQLIAQSHNCIWSLTGQGLLTVRFLNIKLPHRNRDVIRSQGFVRFRVQPRPTLAVGEIIPNHARIVFDYNDPVRTNTATTTVLLPTAVLASHTAAAWEAYPNPATDAVTISATLATGGLVRLELLDVLGRPVRQQTLTAPAGTLRQVLDLRGLTAGLYVLRLTPPTGPATSRQIVRE